MAGFLPTKTTFSIRLPNDRSMSFSGLDVRSFSVPLCRFARVNEGKAVIAVVPEKAEAILSSLKKNKNGKEAQIIGEATKNFNNVILETEIGGRRIISPPLGDPIPRIC